MIAPEESPVRFQYNMLWLPANSLDDTIGGRLFAGLDVAEWNTPAKIEISILF
jgi:hypothetical protein